MRATDLPRWVELAATGGADNIQVRRARRQGKVDPKVFAEYAIEGLDTDSLVERLRDDVVSGRKLPKAEYELVATKGKDKTEVLRERLTIERSEELDLGTDPAALVASTLIREMQNMGRVMAEAVKGSNADIRETLRVVTERLTHTESALDTVLTAAVDMSQLKFEREQLAKKSEDFRAIGKDALNELAPIIGAVMMKLGKNPAPGLVSLFQSITSEQLAKLQTVLTPKQMANLNEVLTELLKAKEKAKKGE